VLRRRPRNVGGRRGAEREAREQAEPSRTELGLRTRAAPDLLALLPAFCAAARPAQNGCCAAGPENLVVGEGGLRGRESSQSQAGRQPPAANLRHEPPLAGRPGPSPSALASSKTHVQASGALEGGAHRPPYQGVQRKDMAAVAPRRRPNSPCFMRLYRRVLTRSRGPEWPKANQFLAHLALLVGPEALSRPPPAPLRGALASPKPPRGGV
jgi:hypothetical protein